MYWHHHRLVFSVVLVFLKIRIITFVYLKNGVVFSSSRIHREFHQTSNRFFSTVRFFKIRLNVTRLLRGCFVYRLLSFQNTNCSGLTQFVIWIYGRLLGGHRKNWVLTNKRFVFSQNLVVFSFPKNERACEWVIT